MLSAYRSPRFIVCWPATERQALVQAYDRQFGDGSLLAAIKADTSGYYLQALTALVDGKPLQNDDPRAIVKKIRDALSNWFNTDEDALINILCRNSNTTIQKARALYKKETKRELFDDVTYHTTSFFGVVGPHPEPPVVRRGADLEDGAALLEAVDEGQEVLPV